VVEEYEVISTRTVEAADPEFAAPQGLRPVPLAGFQPAPERRPPKPAAFQRDFKEDEIDRKENPLRGQEGKDKP
jgi:hypothetical protein